MDPSRNLIDQNGAGVRMAIVSPDRSGADRLRNSITCVSAPWRRSSVMIQGRGAQRVTPTVLESWGTVLFALCFISADLAPSVANPTIVAL